MSLKTLGYNKSDPFGFNVRYVNYTGDLGDFFFEPKNIEEDIVTLVVTQIDDILNDSDAKEILFASTKVLDVIASNETAINTLLSNEDAYNSIFNEDKWVTALTNSTNALVSIVHNEDRFKELIKKGVWAEAFVNNHTAVGEIINDTSALSSLITSAQARNLLVESTYVKQMILENEDATDIIVNNTSAIRSVVQSNHWKNDVLINDYWINALVESEVAPAEVVKSEEWIASISINNEMMELIFETDHWKDHLNDNAFSVNSINQEKWINKLFSKEDWVESFLGKSISVNTLFDLPKTIRTSNGSFINAYARYNTTGGGIRFTRERQVSLTHWESFPQKIDFTNKSILYVWASADTLGEAGTRMKAVVKIGDEEVLEVDGSKSSLTKYTISVSKYTGKQDVSIGFKSASLGGDDKYTATFSKLYVE